MSAPIETSPTLTAEEQEYILSHPLDIQLERLLSECNNRYAYWTDVKYKYKGIELPLMPRLLWGYLNKHRRAASVSIYPHYGLRLFVTPQMQG